MIDYLLLRGFLEEKVCGEFVISDFGREFANTLAVLFEAWNIPQFVLHDPCHNYALSALALFPE